MSHAELVPNVIPMGTTQVTGKDLVCVGRPETRG